MQPYVDVPELLSLGFVRVGEFALDQKLTDGVRPILNEIGQGFVGPLLYAFIEVAPGQNIRNGLPKYVGKVGISRTGKDLTLRGRTGKNKTKGPKIAALLREKSVITLAVVNWDDTAWPEPTDLEKHLEPRMPPGCWNKHARCNKANRRSSSSGNALSS